MPSMTSAALPVGVAVAGATRATVTENFSDVPRAAGLLDDVTVVVLCAGDMTSVVTDDVLAP